MEAALRFFRTYEMWMYVILALAGLVYIRKFIIAWEELRRAAFGLERESAQSNLNQAAGMLVFLFMMAIGVFVVVTFVSPAFPESNPLSTPTMNLLASPTTTLVEGTAEGGTTEISPEELTLTVTAEQELGEGCIPGQIIVTEPKEGADVSGVVVVKGTANIDNFGFYKYEIARPGETIWLTILAGREIKNDEELGQWDTRTLAPGDYMLRLVVTDNEGLSLDPCVIQVRVNNPSVP